MIQLLIQPKIWRLVRWKWNGMYQFELASQLATVASSGSISTCKAKHKQYIWSYFVWNVTYLILISCLQNHSIKQYHTWCAVVLKINTAVIISCDWITAVLMFKYDNTPSRVILNTVTIKHSSNKIFIEISWVITW